MKRLLALILTLFMTPLSAEITTQEVEYSDGETVLKGYYARPADLQKSVPGVLVVHEWWGHNAYARKRAEMLARMGYAALAVDMYGEGKTAPHPEDAAKFAGEVGKNLPLMASRFTSALEWLQGQAGVDGERSAAIGYCFGGGVVLEMARQGVEIDGVASFHGSLKARTPATKGGVKAAILVASGAEDPMVAEEDLVAIREEMAAAEADFHLVVYPGAKHSFTNPEADRFGKAFDLPLAYDEAADKASWAELEQFLTRIFAPVEE